MGELPEIVGKLVICRSTGKPNEADFPNLLSLLLKVGIDKHSDEYIKRIAASYGSWFEPPWPDRPYNAFISASKAEAKRAASYGFEVLCEGSVWLVNCAAKDSLLALPLYRIVDLAEAARWFASVYLCARESRFHENILEDITPLPDSRVSAHFALPAHFERMLPWVDRQEVRVDLHPLHLEACATDDPRVRKALCSQLLANISKSLIREEYTISPETLLPEPSPIPDFQRLLMREILAGNVSECAQCGTPIYVARANAKPFCNRGHQTRYSEKARRRIKKGMSVDEVCEAFPMIGRKTVEGWAEAVKGEHGE